MKKVCVGLLAASLLISVYLLLPSRVDQKQLQAAEEAYRLAEKEARVDAKEALLNRALSIYQALEQKRSSAAEWAKLDYNLANCYFQLGEAPWAIYYYLRSASLLPREKRVKQNLAEARAAMGISVQPAATALLPPISKQEWLGLFNLIGALLFALLSLLIWRPRSPLRRLWWPLLVLWASLLLFVVALHYTTPLEGVAIRGVMLYKEPKLDSTVVQELPIVGGSSFQVVGVEDGGEWLLVEVAGGAIGYLPQEATRLF